MISNLGLFLLCAGQGSRLAPLTHRIPKPLLPLNNKPLANRILEGLKLPLVGKWANIHHLSDQLKTWCLKEQIHSLYEPVLLGSGGCIGYGAPAWKKLDHLLIHNADIAHFFPLTQILSELKPQTDTLYLLASQSRGIQNLECDPSGLLQKVLPRLPAPTPSSLRFAFCGIAIVPLNFVSLLPAYPCDIKPYWKKYIEQGGKIQIIPRPELWFDIGTPLEYAQCLRTFHKLESISTHANIPSPNEKAIFMPAANTPSEFPECLNLCNYPLQNKLPGSIILEPPQSPALLGPQRLIGQNFYWPL